MCLCVVVDRKRRRIREKGSGETGFFGTEGKEVVVVVVVVGTGGDLYASWTAVERGGGKKEEYAKKERKTHSGEMRVCAYSIFCNPFFPGQSISFLSRDFC